MFNAGESRGVVQGDFSQEMLFDYSGNWRWAINSLSF
jgi:hypothetical protein